MSSILYSIQEIANLIGFRWVIKKPAELIKNLLFDSRKMAEANASLFFVLPGRVNAHTFIPDLYQKCIRNFVVYDDGLDLTAFPEANFIFCHHTIQALQQLASFHRKRFTYPVMGITGSNGKTMVKEWLYQLLNSDYKIVRSPKSFNSQLGVPLAVWQMDDSYNIGIFEAGISTTQEMDFLEQVIQPSIGILTNIGSSHDEGFENTHQKTIEKLKLFTRCKSLIINSKFSYLINNKEITLFTWSFEQSANLQIISCESKQRKTLINGIYQNKNVSIQIPFTDKASIENAVICWASMLYLGINQDSISTKMKVLQSVKMRLELKSGKNNCSIIDDSYNSDFSSLDIALDFLNQQQQHPKRTLILSDLYQTGVSQEAMYSKIAQLLRTKAVQRFIGVGENLSLSKDEFSPGSLFFKNTQELIDALDDINFENEAILIKGSRDFRFERISKMLTSKVHETVLEINLNAIEHNLNYYKSALQPQVGIMAVVKAFSYGSGSFEIANLLQYNKVNYLAVAYADEGVALRNNGITLPIMVMSPEISSFDTLIKNGLEPEIYSLQILKAFANHLQNDDTKEYFIHLKIDTGMHRLGFEQKDIAEMVSILTNHLQIKVKSIFSHLVASDDPDLDVFTQQQIHLFKEISKIIDGSLGYTTYKHIGNTSAIHRFNDAQFDWVRLGIGLYGLDSNEAIRNKLEPVLTLKTSIAQIKYVKKGDTVGYSRKGVMHKDGKIATIKIGYADGLSRKLGNGNGIVYINNQEAKTIGNICMDMCMIDISDIEANEGDEVILFNTVKGVLNWADKLETIPYEILTQISQRVKRIYYYQ